MAEWVIWFSRFNFMVAAVGLFFAVGSLVYPRLVPVAVSLLGITMLSLILWLEIYDG